MARLGSISPWDLSTTLGVVRFFPFLGLHCNLFMSRVCGLSLYDLLIEGATSLKEFLEGSKSGQGRAFEAEISMWSVNSHLSPIISSSSSILSFGRQEVQCNDSFQHYTHDVLQLLVTLRPHWGVLLSTTNGRFREADDLFDSTCSASEESTNSLLFTVKAGCTTTFMAIVAACYSLISSYLRQIRGLRCSSRKVLVLAYCKIGFGYQLELVLELTWHWLRICQTSHICCISWGSRDNQAWFHIKLSWLWEFAPNIFLNADLRKIYPYFHSRSFI